MQGESKRYLRIVITGALVLAAARTAYIFYERDADAKRAVEQARDQQRKKDTLNPDYYVTPRKLYAYDLAGAKELTKSPVWVKTGYGSFSYPFDPVAKHADFKHDAGLLLPLEKLEITDVVLDRSPSGAGQKQIMAAYVKDGKHFAVPIGAEQGSSFTLYANEMFFLDDPRTVYKHWPPEIWEAISKHEVRPGMNELQADCSVGLGLLDGPGTGEERVLHYTNGGAPLTVTYRNGKAVDIKGGS